MKDVTKVKIMVTSLAFVSVLLVEVIYEWGDKVIWDTEKITFTDIWFNVFVLSLSCICIGIGIMIGYKWSNHINGVSK